MPASASARAVCGAASDSGGRDAADGGREAADGVASDGGREAADEEAASAAAGAAAAGADITGVQNCSRLACSSANRTRRCSSRFTAFSNMACLKGIDKTR